MGDLFNSILGFLGGTAVAALESFVVWLFQLIVAVFQVLFQLLGFVYQFFVGVLKSVGSFLDKLWNEFFKGILTGIWNSIKSLVSWVEAKLAPVVQFLQKLRKLIDQYYRVYLRPMLQMMQNIRRYLQLLSFLHIGIAQKLDAYLAQIQSKIVTAYATVVGTINTLVDISNALMDPAYLLRKPALLLSLRRQVPALIRVCTGRPPGYWFPSPKGAKGGAFSAPLLPMNFADPTQNPPASGYIGTDDGLGDTSGFLSGFQFADGAVDQAQALDYFDDTLYPDNLCPNGPEHCLANSWGVNNG